MNKLVGYARVSTLDQDLNLQIDGLIKAGCNPQYIFTDKMTGRHFERPGLNLCLEHLNSGDTLVVWRIDRLGRSTIDLLRLVSELRERQIHFKSIGEGEIDTTTPAGEMLFTTLCACARMESVLISTRTKAGMESARKRGAKFGRPPVSIDSVKMFALKGMIEKGLTRKEISAKLNLSRTTIYNYEKKMKECM
jgi:DNA invertase Pin-like site-specific DNA recombinase